jgi:hypothetical protein
MVKKTPQLNGRSANVKRHGLYVVHISLCNVPSFIVSLIGDICKSSHWMKQ